MQKKRTAATRKTSAKTDKMVQAEARVQQWLGVLDNVLDDYERDTPNWRILALFWLIEGSLGSLKKHLETGPKNRWRDPFVEVRYAVNWNWNPSGPDDPVITYGQIKSSSSDSAMTKQVSSIAVETIMQAALRGFTNDVALEKRGKKHLPLIPVEIIASLKKIRSPRKRQLIIDELYRPFSMGAAEVDFGEEELVNGAPLSRKAQQKFAEQSQNMDLPSITMTLTKDGRSIQLVPVFQVHPLNVDVYNKEAYYPLTVGFIITPDALPGEDPSSLSTKTWAQPGHWSAADRRKLWKGIIGAFRKVADSFQPPAATPSEEAVLTVSAKLHVRIDPSNPDHANQAVKQMLDSFAQTGAILEMSHAWDAPSPSSKSPFPSLLKQLDESPLNKKGAALEKLTTALFESISGFHVKNNSVTRTEEIDLVIINGHDDPRWKTGSPLILVECKNRSIACGKNDIVQFKAKLENRRNQCRLGFVVSMKGFSETFRNELLRNSTGNLIIAMIDGEMIREAAEKRNFLEILQRAWDRVVIS